MREMKLQDLKSKTPTELLTFAEELEVEGLPVAEQGLVLVEHGLLQRRRPLFIGGGRLSGTIGFLGSDGEVAKRRHAVTFPQAR